MKAQGPHDTSCKEWAVPGYNFCLEHCISTTQLEIKNAKNAVERAKSKLDSLTVKLASFQILKKHQERAKNEGSD